MITVHKLASILKKLGVKVSNVTEADDMVDAEIGITEAVHVQVGSSYAIVHRFDEASGCFYHEPTRKPIQIDEILGDIRKALQAAQEAVAA